MLETRVGVRYAQSLVDFALEKGAMEEVGKDMQFFVRVCDENPSLQMALKNPIVNHGKKLSILNSIFKGRVNEVSLSIFSIVVKKNREEYLLDIARQFLNIQRKLNGIEIAEVTTTFPLTDSLRQEFISMLTISGNKKIELKEKVDKNIIGGYILKVGDRQIDESISAKLQKLKNKFEDNTYISKY